jgi:hypothetical protein
MKNSIYLAIIVASLRSLDSRVTPTAIFPATVLDWIGHQPAFLFDRLDAEGSRT